ncbi:MAG: DUF362 domain-containing protein [Promethearchaeota archaeon]|jgi:uncharacterized protein (DUF362 family)
MSQSKVSIVKYEKPLDSVRKLVESINLFDEIPKNAKVFIKPNIVYWNTTTNFPKWGVITSSRVIEDVIVILNERGVVDISIGEGIATLYVKDNETAADAFEKLGYNLLKEKYGVKPINTFEQKFEKIDLNTGFNVNFNSDALAADVVIDIPVLKTHSQAVVSLGFKNLKGLINNPSRKNFHSDDPVKNLHHNVAQLPNKLKKVLTIIDGIYTLERGPAMDGKAHRKNILIASSDILSADMVGTKLLGIDPIDVPHLVQAAKDRDRPMDLSDIEIVGEKIDDLASHHEWDFIYSDAGDLPLPFQRIGVKGLKYHKYDSTMCTYCSGINGVLLVIIKNAWQARKGKPFDDIEFLNGKVQEPTPGMNKTVLFGKCQYNKNKDHPDIKEMIPIRGCPPSIDDVRTGFSQIGIELPPTLFQMIDQFAGAFMAKYKGRPEFDESFFQIK